MGAMFWPDKQKLCKKKKIKNSKKKFKTFLPKMFTSFPFRDEWRWCECVSSAPLPHNPPC